MADTKKATEVPSENAKNVPKYFACVHVVNGRAVDRYATNANAEEGKVFGLLCEDCYLGDRPAELEGKVLMEDEAVRHGWLPKSWAMQWLLYITNDPTGGQAVSSWWNRLRGALWGTGLSMAEKYFLFDLFGRGDKCLPPTRPGFGEIDDEEDSEALRILRKWSECLPSKEVDLWTEP